MREVETRMVMVFAWVLASILAVSTAGTFLVSALRPSNEGTFGGLGGIKGQPVILLAQQVPSVVPLANNFYDLGSATTSWKDVYASGTARISGVLTVGSCVGCGGGAAVNPLAQDIVPNANNTFDAGAATSSLDSVYASSTVFADPAGVGGSNAGFWGASSTLAGNLTINGIGRFRTNDNSILIGDGNSGSAATPQLSFIGDTNMGLYRSAADTAAISTAGTGRWRWNSSGHYEPLSDNLYDIGSTSLSARNIYNQANLFSSSTVQVGISGTLSTSTFWSVAEHYAVVTSSARTYLSGITSQANGNDTLCVDTTSWEVERVAGTCAASSRKYKHDIESLPDGALNFVDRLRPVSFARNEDNRKDVGLIAEEVAEVEPRLVRFDAVTGDAEAVQYENSVAYAFKAIQELNVKVKRLEEEIKIYKNYCPAL